MEKTKWLALLNSKRRRDSGKNDFANKNVEEKELRTEIERDYDRILFCTPVRRMADKTQVFPLEKNDGIRNRLTHSHEVSNLARGFGIALIYNYGIAKEVATAARDIPALLAAVGLVHDLGNPPFGHQGEYAIRTWFKEENRKEHITGCDGTKDCSRLYDDFLFFEGNAQAFRLVCRLQLLNDNYGLNLTYATLASMMKYPIGVGSVKSENSIAFKKHGFFYSEEEIAKDVLDKVGLKIGSRHPFAYIMEACDDIAYAVLDVEDAVKKGLASFSDLMAFLRSHCSKDELVMQVVDESLKKHNVYREEKLSPAELNDISMQRFRVSAIFQMMHAAVNSFVDKKYAFIDGSNSESLLDISKAKTLNDLLRKFSREYAFNHRSVLEVELRGHKTIRELMDIFWGAISQVDPGDANDVSQLKDPYMKYVYMRISENYRRVFCQPDLYVKGLPIWYRRCLLLTDMISGMTDSYALALLVELKSFK